MQAINEETPISLETLNARDQPMREVAARLRHLSAQSAVIAVAGDAKMPGLHWGTRVRFCVDSGSQHFAIVGMVVATNLQDPATDETDGATAWREILVRVWDCESASQRRTAPRKRARFAVKYQPVFPGVDVEYKESAANGSESEDGAWLPAQCVDISAGGLRLRVSCPETAMERVRLALTLPACAARPACELQLSGRVLRLERTGGARQTALIAIKFERLSPQNAMLIAKMMSDGESEEG